MTPTITARSLFDDLEQRLKFDWLPGTGEQTDYAISADDLTARPATAGFLNLIHPNKVQVMGTEECAYLDSQDASEQTATAALILKSHPIAVVVADGLEAPALLVSACNGSGTALFRSQQPSWEVVSYLQYYISRKLAPTTTLYGVFMEVFTIGVLITGKPGSGKSELALELLNRGHRLIADDAPEFKQVSPEIIDGRCPEALQDCLEVRGLGVLNVRRMFGDAAVKANKFLRLIIHLDVPENAEPAPTNDRLRGNADTSRVLDLDIPRITLPVMAGRNLAVITEAAVRDFMLKMRGYDAATAFINRHSRLMQRQARDLAD